MNRNQFVILLVLVLVLGGAGLYIYQKRTDTTTTGDPTLGKKLLGEFPVNDITRITIKEGPAELNLVKKDELWRVRERNDYPANYAQISEALLKLREMKVVQSEKVGPSQLPRLALVAGEGSNTAVVVQFKGQNDKDIATLMLGKKHMRKSNRPAMPQFGDMEDQGWPDGRYVKVGANSDFVALVSDPLANLEPKADQWLNKDFFKVEKARSVAVTFPAATNSWKLSRDSETAEWKLADLKPGEQLDATKVASVSNPLGSPSFTDVATSASAESLGLDKPTVLTVDTFDGFAYAVKVGQKTNDNYPILVNVTAQLPKERTPGKDEKPEDKAKLDKEFKDQQKKLEEKLAQERTFEKWTYLVSSWTLDPLLKERAQFMAEKKEEPKAGDKPAQDATNALDSIVPAPVGGLSTPGQ